MGIHSKCAPILKPLVIILDSTTFYFFRHARIMTPAISYIKYPSYFPLPTTIHPSLRKNLICGFSGRKEGQITDVAAL